MLLRQAFLIFAGICAGIGVSAGTFAFLLVIHVVPRIIQKAGLRHKTIAIENSIIRGVLFGTAFSLFSWTNTWLLMIPGQILVLLFGLSAGVFVGAVAVALAEILDTFPIFFQRLRLRDEAALVQICVMALGKSLGALFYFCFGYQLP